MDRDGVDPGEEAKVLLGLMGDILSPESLSCPLFLTSYARLVTILYTVSAFLLLGKQFKGSYFDGLEDHKLLLKRPF